jgi:serralysin
MPDWYFGTSGNDYITRNEFYFPGEGYSLYDGGDGIDTLDFSGAASTGWVYFDSATPWNGVEDRTRIIGIDPTTGETIYAYAWIQSIEVIIAGAGNDTLFFDSYQRTLDGGFGNDTFMEGIGSLAEGDILDGNEGDDILDLRTDTDTGGVFTGTGWVIDLNAGTITNRSGRQGTILDIENVYGSWGDDTLVPTFDTVLLDGSNGQDVFDLNNGVFASGQTYIGGGGLDVLDFSTYGGDYYVDLSLNFMESGGMFSQYAFVFSIETVHAGRGDDTLVGIYSLNWITGGKGHDNIDGQGGDDTLSGGMGNDTILGGDGNDSISGGTDNDDLYGDAGDDKLYGNSGNDTINGNSGNDTLFGGIGADWVIGGSGDDKLFGQNDNDTLRGGGGNDRLFGGKGDDNLAGGLGNDKLGGQSGADVFIFADGDGNDTITDFNVAELGEVIDLGGIASITNMAELNAAAVDTAAGVLIDFGGGNSVLLLGVFEADLSADDFLFT